MSIRYAPDGEYCDIRKPRHKRRRCQYHILKLP
nr:MAG TPA: L28 Mitochondrial ribosomal protein L28 [Caudoviricetes sp.]